MVDLVAVSKTYYPSRRAAVHAVRDVTCTLQPGSVTGLLGPNGAGKTTLIRLMTSSLMPSAGCITIDGHDTVLDSRRARAAIGYLAESAPLYLEMRVADYLLFRARLFDVPRPRRAVAVQRAAERCRLSDMLRRRIGHLSKGYRQRVGLAAAILHDPRVVILDEPASGLDPTQIVEMRTLIRDLAHAADGPPRTVLLSSHMLPEVELTCDRILIMSRGRVRADGTPASLLAGAGNAITYTLELMPADAGTPLDAARIAGRLAAVPGVASLHPQPGACPRYTITPAPGAGDLREALARACAPPEVSGVIIRELSVARPTLEAVFAAAVAAEDEPAAPGRGAAA
jgi:ABC-2 type transport system ATP-binding protein